MKTIEKFDEFLAKIDDAYVIFDDDFREFLGIKQPNFSGLDAKQCNAEMQRFRFEYLQKSEKFFHYALTRHKKLFVRIQSVGYRILEPEMQADYSIEAFERKFQSALRKASLRLRNIDKSALSAEDRKRATDMTAHLAQIGNVLKSRTRQRSI